MTKGHTLTTRKLFSAAAWGAMALATVSMTLPEIASAAEREQSQGRSGGERWSGNRDSGNRNSGSNPNREQYRAQRSDGAARQAAPQQRPQRQEPNRTSNAWSRSETRPAQVQSERQPARNMQDIWRSAREAENREQNRNRVETRSQERNSCSGNRQADRYDRRDDRYDRRDDRRDDRYDRRDDRRGDRYDRRDNRNDYRDARRWDRNDWRRDNRYDWRNYRSRNRSTYRIGRYYSPYYGYNYRRLSIGFTLGSMFYSNRYWIDDPYMYRLPPVYGPYRWVRYYDDVLLVNIYSGEVVDVIYDFFW